MPSPHVRAVFLITGGRLDDRIGRRRPFSLGLEPSELRVRGVRRHSGCSCGEKARAYLGDKLEPPLPAA